MLGVMVPESDAGSDGAGQRCWEREGAGTEVMLGVRVPESNAGSPSAVRRWNQSVQTRLRAKTVVSGDVTERPDNVHGRLQWVTVTCGC